MSPREEFVFVTDVDTSALNDPKEQIKASVFEGKLTVTIKGQTQEVELPDDAFTDDVSARLEQRQLTITIARRDPQGPAMQEKRLLNPDRHPVELDVTMPKELLAKSVKAHAPSPTEQPGGKTPAQQTLTEGNTDMYGTPEATAYKMPEVNMGSSIVTAMPVMTNAGGAVDTVSKGETVVAVPGMTGSKHLTGVSGGSGDEAPSADELADKLRDTVVRDQAPKGAAVLFGQKEKENEAKFDDSAATPTRGTAAGGSGGEAAGSGQGVTGVGGEAGAVPVGGAVTADSPAGDEEHLRQTGARGDKVLADFTQNKVGMEYEELTAADRYVTAESRDNEPISSLKQPGPKCELCECNPCQCDKYQHSGGAGNNPYEMTYPEQKRGGRPAIHRPHKEETGSNAHAARDYRGHAGQANASHVGIGGKLADYQGNVPEGVGDWSDPKYQERAKAHGVHGATHTGGASIELGGPGRTQVSDAVRGGPVVKGSKTTFTTMG